MIPSLLAPPEWWRALMPGEWARLGEFWVGLVMITPASAQQMLKERYRLNRKINPIAIKLLEMDIAADKFFLNGETIVFDLDGMIANGHHRLTAIGNSEKAVRCLVVIGVSPQRAFTTFDQHAKRKLSQILQMVGLPNSAALAGALSYVNNFLRSGEMTRTLGQAIISRDMFLELHNEHPGVSYSVNWVMDKLGGSTPFKSPSMLGALHFAFSAAVKRINRQDIADDFFERMLHLRMTDEPKWRAPELLIHRLNDAKGSKSEEEEGKKRPKKIVRQTMPEKYKSALTIKAWNFYRREAAVGVLRWIEGEPYPRIEGLEYDGDGRPKL